MLKNEERMKKLMAKYQIVEDEKPKHEKAYGVMKKSGVLYKCFVDKAGAIVKGTFKVLAGKCLEDIATEVSGVKNERKWSSYKNNKTGQFVRGTFKWLD